LIAILFDEMRCPIRFKFTLTQTLSLKGEGIFDNFLSIYGTHYFLSPPGRGLR